MADVKPKKRGRKPRETYTVSAKPGLKTTVDEPQETIILYLPISSSDVGDDLVFCENICHDKSVEPIPYNPIVSPGPYQELPESSDGIDKPNTDAENKCIEFEDKKTNRLIRTAMTDVLANEHEPISCWWCCHPFLNQAVRLPVSFSEDTDLFHGYGHFCSYNCACSYLFNSPEYFDKKWDIYSLLNMMFRRANLGVNKKVRLAPPRQDLKMFGGHLNIHDFRAANNLNEKEYKLLVPPMTLIIPQIEETKPKFEENNLIPVNRQKMQNATEALKIRRSKPILDHKHTLNSFMTIKKVTA